MGKLAVELAPEWAQAHRVLGNAFEAAGRMAEASEALRMALSLGKGLDKNAVACQLKRLESGGTMQFAEEAAKEEPLWNDDMYDKQPVQGFEKASLGTSLLLSL